MASHGCQWLFRLHYLMQYSNILRKIVDSRRSTRTANFMRRHTMAQTMKIGLILFDKCRQASAAVVVWWSSNEQINWKDRTKCYTGERVENISNKLPEQMLTFRCDSAVCVSVCSVAVFIERISFVVFMHLILLIPFAGFLRTVKLYNGKLPINSFTQNPDRPKLCERCAVGRMHTSMSTEGYLAADTPLPWPDKMWSDSWVRNKILRNTHIFSTR